MWGSFGSGNGQFNGPYGIVVDSQGSVYVADQGNHRIQEFTSSGSFLFATGELGSQDGQFRFPAGLAVDGADRVYMADTEQQSRAAVRDRGGAIVAVKDAQPDDPQDFTFTAGGGLSPASFQLDDDGNANNGSPTGVVRGRTWIRLFACRDRPGGWDLFGHVLGRLRPVEHRRLRRGGRDVHVHQQQAGPDRRRAGLDPERAAGLRFHGRRAASAPPPSSSTTTATIRTSCPTAG